MHCALGEAVAKRELDVKYLGRMQSVQPEGDHGSRETQRGKPPWECRETRPELSSGVHYGWLSGHVEEARELCLGTIWKTVELHLAGEKK